MITVGGARDDIPRTRWLAVGFGWAAALIALLTWVLRTPPPVLREELKTVQLWSLDFCLALGLGIAVFSLRARPRALRAFDVLALTLFGAVALVLTLRLPVQTNRIFYDEQIYQNVGQNLSDMKLAQMCNDGAVERGRLHCDKGEYNKQPYGYPHILSLAYRSRGVADRTAFAVNAAVMAITVAALYLLVVLLFADRVAAFFSALCFVLNPEQLLWSATAAAEASASLACVVALLATAWFVRTRTTAALMGVAAATAYAIQFRPESLLLVPVIALLLWQRARDEFFRTRLWWAGLLLVALAAVHVGHVVAVRNEGWGTTADRFSIGYLMGNLRVNGWFYVADRRFPVLYTLLAILGVLASQPETGRLAISAYFSVFFGVSLLFYAGSYDFGADVRYALATFPPLTILAGLGASAMIRKLKRFAPAGPVGGGLAIAILLQFLIYVPVVRAASDGAWAARADVEFARSLVPDLGGGSYVLTHNPGMFQVWGVSAGQMSLVATNPGFLAELRRRYPGGVYLHWNFWCNVQDPIQPKFCSTVLGLARARVVRERWERDQHFALYRLEPAPVVP